MAKIYKQNCKKCGKYYEGTGKCYCSMKCINLGRILSDEHKKKLSEYWKKFRELKTKRCIVCNNPRGKNSKYFCSNKCQYLFYGENNPQKRRTQIECIICDKNFEVKKSHSHLRKTCSNECNIKNKTIQAELSNNANWRGGISFEPYPREFNDILKDLVRERDSFICQVCGKTQEQELKDINRKLTIHHIDYNKKNCKPSNLIATCTSCNAKVNYLRGFWLIWFKTTNNKKDWGLDLSHS